jgi:hypothetical protein
MTEVQFHKLVECLVAKDKITMHGKGRCEGDHYYRCART